MISLETLQAQYQEFITNDDWRAFYGYDATPEDFVLSQTFVAGSWSVLPKEAFKPLKLTDDTYTVEHVDGLPLNQNITTKTHLDEIIGAV